MMTAESVFDKSAAGWTVDFDGSAKNGYTVITATLPDGWADGDLYLVCVPFDVPHWVKHFDGLKIEVSTAELGIRGYVYVANLKDGTQKSTPFYTYRIRDGEVVAIGW